MSRALGSKYTLEGTIGRGAMGEVFAGTDQEGHQLAFKVLHNDLAHDPAIVERFVRERSILLSLRSENLVEVHDLVIEGDTLAIVMELVEGTDLRGLMNAQGTLAPSEACRIGAGIARGLATVHAQGIVHRDVKPENILIDSSVSPVRPKVTDFGISSLMDTEKARSTMLVGTPQYIAPEVSEGGEATPAADFYALGILLYELASGVTPFAGGSVMAVLRRHSDMQPGRPVGIPDSLWDLITWLLAKDPAQRPTGAAQVATGLDALAIELVSFPPSARLSEPPAPVPVIEAQPTQAVAYPTQAPPASSPGLTAAYATVAEPAAAAAAPRRRKKPVVAIAMGAVALLLIAGGGIFVASKFMGGPGEPEIAAAQTPSEEPSPSETPSPTPSEEPSETPSTEATDTALAEPTDTLGDEGGMPNLIGKTTTEARALLGDQVLIDMVNEYDDSQADGTILEQQPLAGNTFDSAVTLTVARSASTKYLADLTPLKGEWGSSQVVAISGETQPYSVTKDVCDYGQEQDLVEYNLGKNYASFTAVVGQDDDSPNSDAKVLVEVLGDDRKLASALVSYNEAVKLDANLTGVLRLKIQWQPQTCGAEDSSSAATLALGNGQLKLAPGKSAVSADPTE